MENAGSGRPSAYYERLSRDGDFENRLAAQIAWRLERRIRENALCGGALIGTERALANDLDVSRATVREALHILEIRGAVRVDRGNGGGIRVTVPEFSAVANVLSRCLRSCAASEREFVEAATILDALACDADPWDAGSILKQGALLKQGMPKFGDLTPGELAALRHYIRQQALAPQHGIVYGM